MSVAIMGPADAKSGSSVVIMVTGLSSSPKDGDIGIRVDGAQADGTATWDPARGKLSVEVPTKSGQRIVKVNVDLPNGGAVRTAVPLRQ